MSRLSKLRGHPLVPQLGCVTRNGPWLGEIIVEHDCSGYISTYLQPFGGGSIFPSVDLESVDVEPAGYEFFTPAQRRPDRDSSGNCTSGQLTQCGNR